MRLHLLAFGLAFFGVDGEAIVDDVTWKGASAFASLEPRATEVVALARQLFDVCHTLGLETMDMLRKQVNSYPLAFQAGVVIAIAFALLVGPVRAWINFRWKRGMRERPSKDLRFRRQTSGSCSSEDDFDFDAQLSDMEDHEDGCSSADPTPRNSKLKINSAPSLTNVMWEAPSFPSEMSHESDTAGALIARCTPLNNLEDPQCLKFLRDSAQVLKYGSGEEVFKSGALRDAFLVVRSGCVQVELPTSGISHHDEYTLGKGDAVTGLIFVLASLEAGPGMPAPPDHCRFHHSSAHAGAQGAELVSLPTKVLSQAFDDFPEAMRSMAQLLSSRSRQVVEETLARYFGLGPEIIAPADESGQQEAVVPKASTPAATFAELLGCQEDDREEIQSALAQATMVEKEEGRLALDSSQRSTCLLVLLEGNVVLESPAVQRSRTSSHDRRVSSGTQPLTARDLQLEVVAPAKAWGRILPGEAVGELSVFTDAPRPWQVRYRCKSRCRFASLPQDAVQRLLELRPRATCLRLLHLAAARVTTFMHRVDAALEWVHVEGGHYLYREGDAMKGFFVVLSGRLQVTTGNQSVDEAGEGGPQHLVRSERFSLQRGSLCGELDCLRDATRYSKTVQASRDTEVCRVSPVLLQLMAANHPRSLLHFSALVGGSGSSNSEAKSSKGGRDLGTIAIVPLRDDAVNTEEVCNRLVAALRKLGKTAHVSADSAFIKHSSHLAKGTTIARQLALLEERCTWVVYEAEDKLTDWTKRCIRQADLIIIATNFDGSSSGRVPASEVELYIQRARPSTPCELLLVYDAGAAGLRQRQISTQYSVKSGDLLMPGLWGFVSHHTQVLAGRHHNMKRSTRHYLQPRPWVQRWHHARLTVPEDWGRVARLIAGCAIGLCLGGGGARGNAHFGVIRAMEELSIPVDVVSGTSFGALAASVYALNAAEPKGKMFKFVRRMMERRFSTRGMLMDINFPRTAYFTGAFLNSVLQNTFARRRIEDLLVPCALTSTDIAHLRARVHRTGPIWRVVRASMSLVGFVPPLPYKEGVLEQDTQPGEGNFLLVDGGYANNFPVEELHELGAGTVVGVVVCPSYGTISTEYGDVVEGGWVFLRRSFGCCLRRRREEQFVQDPPTQAEIQERLMFLVDSMRGDAQTRADVSVHPPIDGYGLLDFGKYKELEALGYNTALPQLKEWLAGNSKAAEQVRSIVEAFKQPNAPVSSAGPLEAGSRRQLWRRKGSRFQVGSSAGDHKKRCI